MAVGDRRANAVGPVRLVCEPDALKVELLGVGRFAAGFAFGTLAYAVSFRVPYTAVRGMVRDGRSLLLSLDPRAAAPHTRFALTRFSRLPPAALLAVFRARGLASLASHLLPLPLGAWAAWEAYLREPSLGELGSPPVLIAFGLLVALASWRIFRAGVSWLSWGGPLSDRLRAAFERAVGERMGLELAPELVPAPPVLSLPPVALIREPSVEAPAAHGGPGPAQALSRVGRPFALAAVGALGIAAALAAAVVVKRFGVAQVVLLPVEDAQVGLGEPALAVAQAGLRDGGTKHPSCACEHVDSSLWRQGLPQLSVMVSPVGPSEMDDVWLEAGKTYPIRPADPKDPEVVLEVAVVNNSGAMMRSITLVMTFARRTPSGGRTAIKERGMHWAGKLGPGESVKWHIKAAGTEVRLDTQHDARLAEVGVAGADAFYPLAKARLPIVRLHGAMLLALLRDSRAAALARAAGELPAAPARARDELLRTLEPLVVCDPRPGATGGIEACLFNGTDRMYRGVAVIEHAGDEHAGDGHAGDGHDRRHEIHDFFHPGEGLFVRIEADPKSPMLELVPIE